MRKRKKNKPRKLFIKDLPAYRSDSLERSGTDQNRQQAMPAAPSAEVDPYGPGGQPTPGGHRGSRDRSEVTGQVASDHPPDSGAQAQADSAPTDKSQPDTSSNASGDASDSEQRPLLEHALQEFADCVDFVHRTFPEIGLDVLYLDNLVGREELRQEVFEPLLNVNRQTDVGVILQRSQYVPVKASKELIIGLLNGQSALFHGADVYLADTFHPESRPITPSETESVITGPHESFTELLTTNVSLIRRRIKSSHLKVEQLAVGEIAKASVYILYLKDIANPEFVSELKKRIARIETDGIEDLNMLIQVIAEHPNSIFPQFLTTERPDVVVSKLLSGKIIGMMDGSPSAFCAPSSFFEFFASSDDYYQRWMLGTAVRLLRFAAFIITISFTSFYVAITTYHYEMIPEALLLTLAESRSKVPFPPIYEALLMEITIELLREAGARLPTKIGQTIGIVGGIVIGQAAVQAGLTSNVLIIAVASSAISSFVIPSYIMSASIRLIRFGLILLAGWWGNLGLMLGIAAVVIHLSGLTNLGTSYVTPIAPMKWSDWKDTFVRAPLWMIRTRPSISKTGNRTRLKMKK